MVTGHNGGVAFFGAGPPHIPLKPKTLAFRLSIMIAFCLTNISYCFIMVLLLPVAFMLILVGVLILHW